MRRDPSVEIQRKIARLEELGAEVRRLYAKGLSVRAIKKRLLGREPHITYLTLWHFSGSHLIQAYLREQSSAG